MKGSWGVRPREETSTSGSERRSEKGLEGARETMRLRRNSMNEGQDSEIEGKRRKRENEME